MSVLYELGFEQIRLTISFNRFGPDFFAAIPYVRAARALGMDVLGIIGQFSGLDLVQALSDPESREEVLETYYQIFSPLDPGFRRGDLGRIRGPDSERADALSRDPPDVCVRDYLRPASYHLREDDPNLTLVSAAPIGSAAGLLRGSRNDHDRARAVLRPGSSCTATEWPFMSTPRVSCESSRSSRTRPYG
jgi:hypothetical protein